MKHYRRQPHHPVVRADDDDITLLGANLAPCPLQVFELEPEAPYFIGIYAPDGQPIIAYPAPPPRIGFPIGDESEDDEMMWEI